MSFSSCYARPRTAWLPMRQFLRVVVGCPSPHPLLSNTHNGELVPHIVGLTWTRNRDVDHHAGYNPLVTGMRVAVSLHNNQQRSENW